MSQKLDDQRLNEIVDNVLVKVREQTGGKRPQPAAQGPSARVPATAPMTVPRTPATPAIITGRRRGIFDDVDSAIRGARVAFEEYNRRPLADRYRACEAIRAVCRANIEEMSSRAVEESTYGRVEDKLQKNRLAIEKTPGPEDLQPQAWSGDEGLTLLERAPWGVIGAISPVTNITETLICNSIGMLAAGNAVVFNVHPFAKVTSSWLISMINEALVRAGLPDNLMCGVAEPTIASAQALMNHDGLQLLVVTGGPAVVAEAMRSGSSVVAAGPGNPPWSSMRRQISTARRVASSRALHSTTMSFASMRRWSSSWRALLTSCARHSSGMARSS